MVFFLGCWGCVYFGKKFPKNNCAKFGEKPPNKGDALRAHFATMASGVKGRGGKSHGVAARNGRGARGICESGGLVAALRGVRVAGGVERTVSGAAGGAVACAS